MKTTGESARMITIARISLTRRLRRGGGFTFIELLVVMVVVAVMALVAIPIITTLSADRSTFAARQLLRDLSFARQRAVATGTRSWVVFDTVAHTWTIFAEDPLAPGRAGATVIQDPATGHDFVQTLDTNEFAGVQFLTVDFDGNLEIGFDWLGQPLNSTEASLVALGSVTLSGNDVVDVQTETGYITFTPPP